MVGCNPEANELANILLNTLVNLANCIFPETLIMHKITKHSRVSWFDDDLHRMRDHQFLNLLKKSAVQPDLVSQISAFRRKYRSALILAKKKANMNYIERADNPVRAAWQLVNHKRGLTRAIEEPVR